MIKIFIWLLLWTATNSWFKSYFVPKCRPIKSHSSFCWSVTNNINEPNDWPPDGVIPGPRVLSSTAPSNFIVWVSVFEFNVHTGKLDPASHSQRLFVMGIIGGESGE